MKKTFVVATTGGPDSQGDILMPGAIKNKTALVTNEFDSKRPISYANIEEIGNEIKATADIPDEYLGKYPAIGFQIIKSETNEYGGRTLHEIKLKCIGLSISQNVDPHIKPIK